MVCNTGATEESTPATAPEIQCNTSATDGATPRNTVATPADQWTVARLMRSQGHQWDTIASHTGLSATALRSRASRLRWDIDAQAAHVISARGATQQVSIGVQNVVASAKGEIVSAVDLYKEKALGIVNRGLNHLDNLSQGDDIDLDAMEKLARSLKLIDDVGRRTHGLDADGGRQMIGLRQTITIVQASPGPAQPPAIDV